MWAQKTRGLNEELVDCDFQECSYYKTVEIRDKELLERGTKNSDSRIKKQLQLVKEK